MIPNLTIGDTIDCSDAKRVRNFYADLTRWEKTVVFDCLALKADIGMTFLFSKTDIPYVPTVWPEEPGRQQKQMHFNYQVDNLPDAVDEAIHFGAVKAAAQYGGEHFVTMIDLEGHPFCLCRK